MEDLVARHHTFLADVTDCDLIAKLAGDPAKRETFRHLRNSYGRWPPISMR